MQRVLTGVLAGLLMTAAMFLLAPPWFLALVLAGALLAVREYLQLARRLVPALPGGVLYCTVPLQAAAVYAAAGEGTPWPGWANEALALGLPLVLGVWVLWRRVPMAQTLLATGVLAFGQTYLAFAAGAMACVQRTDPWLFFWLAALVWLGDSGALYGGRLLGRRPLASVVSPKKTWEGAAAGLLVSILVSVVFSQLRLGRLEPRLLALAVAVALLAQVGDLVESMFKRGAGLKDSGHFLPGHGGMLDRIDAMLFGAPALWLGMRALGPQWFVP